MNNLSVRFSGPGYDLLNLDSPIYMDVGPEMSRQNDCAELRQSRRFPQHARFRLQPGQIPVPSPPTASHNRGVNASRG